jgi:SulP family sulfate permease
VIIDFSDSRVVDMSGIEALNKLTERYEKVGKKLHLKHLSEDCRQLLNNANDIIDINIYEDPSYIVLTDEI